MATRTYQTTDWKIWKYKPQSGRFRLDFSELDGADTLGSSPGTMEAITEKIAGINISSGGTLTGGSLMSMNPSTATFTFETLSFNRSDLIEYYAGNRIAITLANSGSITNTIYGANSLVFEGIVTDININLDPVSNIAIVMVTCTSLWSALLNQLTTIKKTTTDLKTSFWTATVRDDGITGISYTSTVIAGSGTSHYGTTSSVTDTWGSFLDEMANSETLFAVPYYETAVNYAKSDCRFYRVVDLAPSVSDTTIPKSKIYGVEFGINSADIPSNYNLTSDNGNTLISNSPVGNVLGSNNSFSTQVDVLDQTELQTIYDRMSQVKAGIAPTQVMVEVARKNQPYLLDIYPNNLVNCGFGIIADLSAWGFSATTRMYVVGRTIEVDTDTFKVTYTVTKGK